MSTKSTLMHYNKSELIDRIIALEHNLSVSDNRFEVQYANCIKMIEDMNLLNQTYKKAIRHISE